MSWNEVDQAQEKSFVFKDFVDAFSFLTKVAIISEKHNHHPEIYNVYNQVKLRLNTHDAGGIITEQDKKLAEAIDQLQR